MSKQKYDSVIHVTQSSEDNWIQISFIKIPCDSSEVEAKHVRMTKEQFAFIQEKVSSGKLPCTLYRDATQESNIKEAEAVK